MADYSTAAMRTADLEAPKIKVKVRFGEEVRRFSCAESFDSLAACVAERFGFESIADFGLQYEDEDQDQVTVGSTEELIEAITCTGAASGTLRMTLVPCTTPSMPASSPAETGDAAVPQDMEHAKPTEGHLTQLLKAVLEALDMDSNATLEWLAHLDPAEVKKMVKTSPLALIGSLLAFRKNAGDTFAAAAEAAQQANASENGRRCANEVENFLRAFQERSQGMRAQPAAAVLASSAAASLASHMARLACEHAQHVCEGTSTTAPAEKPTADTVQQQQPDAPDPPASRVVEQQEVTITDTDGDVMVFKLAADGSRVQEFVNGTLELDDVKYLQMDAALGQIRDSKGRFTIKPEDRTEKMQALTALLARAGVSVQQVPVQTVYIDIDLHATAEQQHQARQEAGDAVREAALEMGADPDVALKKLAAVFAALPAASSDEEQAEAKNNESQTEYAGKWSEQLRLLREMGMLDGSDHSEWDLVQLLEKHLGSLDRVVDVLMEQKLQHTDKLV